jgi:hypothetical protein
MDVKSIEEQDYDISNTIPQMENEQVQQPYSGLDFNAPIDSMEALSNKLVSTFNANKQISIKKPLIVNTQVCFLALDREKKPLLYKGLPVVKYIRDYPVFTGWEEVKLDFPIADWFTDSTTSSFLEKEEARIVRDIDDLAFSLFEEQVKNPEVDHSEFLGHLFWLKSSFTDTAKGRGGEAAKMSKTVISRSEMNGLDYNKDFQKELEQRKKGGLLGWGNFLGFL